VFLEGGAYDKETHEPIITDSEEEERRVAKKKKKATKLKMRAKRKARGESTESSNGENEDTELPTRFMKGRFCQKRSNVYHQMTHWGE
jgi:hypothetical protein